MSGKLKNKFAYIILLLLIGQQGVTGNNTKHLSPEFQNQIQELCQTNPDSAIFIVTELLPKVSNLKKDSLEAKAHYYLALAWYYNGKYRISNQHYNKALRTEYATKNLYFKSRCENNLGVNYEMLEQFENAIEHYLKSNDIDKLRGDSAGVALGKINIGLLYGNIGQFTQAEEILRDALEYFARNKNIKGQALAYQNLGKVSLDKKKYQEAWQYFTKSRQLYIQCGEIYELGILLISMTTCAVERQNFEIAETLIDSSLLIADNGSYRYMTIRARLAKANIYIHQNKYEKARSVLDSTSTSNIRSELNRVKMLVEVHAKQNHPLQFNKWFETYIALKDSLRDISNHELINELHIRYKTKLKEDLLEQQNEVIRAIKTRNEILLISLVLFTVLVLIIIWYNRKLQASYKEIFKKNIELTNSLHLNRLVAENPTNSGENMNQEPTMELWNKIMALFNKEKPHTNPGFSLEDLAIKCNSNKTYISSTIKNYAKCNFKTLVNRFRVEESKLILKENNNFSMDATAEKAGFNSLTSFYRAFKNYTGLTPVQYQKYLGHDNQ